MAYAKMAGPVPRPLILESRYWLDTACANAAKRMGWDVMRVPVVAEGVLPREAVERVVERLKIPISRAYEVATFYKSFSLQPRWT